MKHYSAISPDKKKIRLISYVYFSFKKVQENKYYNKLFFRINLLLT